MVLKNKNKHEILDNINVCLGEDDKISNLPDALIHHILSFCPILCAMSTCILSKKWNHIVSSIPILDFRNWQVDNTIDKKLETRRLMNCLDTVLCLHEKPDIQKFCLMWDDDFDEFQVYKWISILIKRKVRELYLCFEGPEICLNFPLSFFTCDSLTVLELIFVRLNVPSTVSFPRLKVLRLIYINFVNGFSPNKLVSNCPILEELSLEMCYGLESEVLCIANLALKKLNIQYCKFGESTVKICSPNLSTISYGEDVPADFVIDSFPSLVEADINMLYAYDGTKKPVLIKLFEKLATVRLLKMSGLFVQVLSEADILLTSSLTFENLIRLEICSPCLVTMKRFFRFLQLKPNLESILFAHSIKFLDEEDDGCWSLDRKWPLQHLKSIKFDYFDGEPAQLNAIKVFLKYARFIETVTIIATPDLSEDREKQVNVMKLLLMFPKPADCVVKLDGF